VSAEPAWVRRAIWWRVYPLGFTGAYPPPPAALAGPPERRLRRSQRERLTVTVGGYRLRCQRGGAG
jgi:hypothetical protein